VKPVVGCRFSVAGSKISSRARGLRAFATDNRQLTTDNRFIADNRELTTDNQQRPDPTTRTTALR